MVKALLLQMIAQMFCRHMMIPVQHAPSEKSQRLKEMLQYIRQHYASSLTIAVMAEQFHMSEKYFSRYFRIATGQNFTAYLNTVRIEKAQSMLLETAWTERARIMKSADGAVMKMSATLTGFSAARQAFLRCNIVRHPAIE